MNGNTIGSHRYRLSNLLISETDNNFTVFEYIYYKKENLIRSISHPALINNSEDTLYIKMNQMHGEDTGFSLKELSEIFTKAPRWNKTNFYQFIESDNKETHLSKTGMVIEYSKIPYEKL